MTLSARVCHTMMPPRDVLIFSDIDGTLLDAAGLPPRAWPAMRDVLDEALIVLCSSRTVRQVRDAQHRLGLSGPFIAENGALLCFPDDWPDAPAQAVTDISIPDLRVVRIGTPAPQLRSVLLGVASALLFTVEVGDERLLHDLSSQASGTGRVVLVPNASQRSHSVLMQVAASPERAALLLRAMARAHLTVTNGGRWLVVQHGSSKGMAAGLMRTLLRSRLRPEAPAIAVGDSDNDRSLLESMDVRWVLRSDDGTVSPSLASLDGITVATTPGVNGWSDLLPQLRRDLVTTGGIGDE